MITLLAITAIFTACSKQSSTGNPQTKADTSLRTAIDELVRLDSYTAVGISYSEYSERLLTANGNIDVSLQHTPDTLAKQRISEAVRFYLEAREVWAENVKNKIQENSNVRLLWLKGEAATKQADRYLNGSEKVRSEMEALEADQRQSEDNQREREVEARAAIKAGEAKEALERKIQAQQRAQRESEQGATLARAAEREEQERQKEKLLEIENEKNNYLLLERHYFCLKRITIKHKDGILNIRQGADVVLVRKNADGTLRVGKNGVEGDFEESKFSSRKP